MDDALSHMFTLADAYVAATKVSESTLSGMVLNGGNRLRDLRAGDTDIGHRRLLKALQWFSDNWPADTQWPTAIVRPDRTPVPVEGAPS